MLISWQYILDNSVWMTITALVAMERSFVLLRIHSASKNNKVDMKLLKQDSIFRMELWNTSIIKC